MADTMIKPNVDEIVKALRKDTEELDLGPPSVTFVYPNFAALDRGSPHLP